MGSSDSEEAPGEWPAQTRGFEETPQALKCLLAWMRQGMGTDTL